MHFAIIAAGEGSRLREEGIGQPKPLVPILGVPMIDRLMQIMSRCGAESISVICRQQMTDVWQHLVEYQRQHSDIDIRLVSADTPSSMHSLARLSSVIPEGKVCVTTVDTIFQESDFAAYVEAFERSDSGMFVVTPFVDDEKPLWVGVDALQAVSGAPIIGFYDHAADLPATSPRLVSGGIYGLDTRQAWPVLHQCLADGQSRMRNYQRALVSNGLKLQAYVFDHIMDIDHASDLQKAEAWLSSPYPRRRILAISRSLEYSPNNVDRDAAILEAVISRLETSGCEVHRCTEEQFATMPITDCDRYDLVIHMVRRMKTLQRLQQLHVRVVNRPQAVQTVAKSRELTLMLLQQVGVVVPAWWSYDPEEDALFQCEPELQQLLPGWVKAMREGGALPDDVTWVNTPLEADARILELAAQHVPDIVVNRHEEGDLLKVYVIGERLWTFYPQVLNYSKFGKAEQHNSPLSRIRYDFDELQNVVRRVSCALGLEIFGLDAIIRPDGTIVIIDVNDWPTFSACRDEAADAIVKLISDK